MKFKNWRPSPRIVNLLKEPDKDNIGTGIIVICGSARSAKSTMMLSLVEWAANNTKRNFSFIGLPDQYIENLPIQIRKKSNNPKLEEITKIRDNIVILDDSAATMNSKDAISSGGKLLSRLSGVISHLGLTLILTVQSMAGLDLSLLRYCEIAAAIKRVDPMALRVERNEWMNEVQEGQHELRPYNFDKSLYYCITSGMVCKHPFNEWMKNDVLSRPFRYLSQKELDNIVYGINTKKKKKVSKNAKE